jgi:hypothetical protein
MKQHLARSLNSLGRLFPELRARPAHASAACAQRCYSEYLACAGRCTTSGCQQACENQWNLCDQECDIGP